MMLPGLSLFVVCGISGFRPAFFWPICLLSPAAAPLGVALFIRKEMSGQGLTSAIDTSQGTPLAGVWAFQLFDALAMAWLAWYVEQIIPAPGSSASKKRWDFVLPACLRCAGNGPPEPLPAGSPVGSRELSELSRLGGSSCSGGGSAEAGSGGVVDVQALHLQKTFHTGRTPVHAVTDLSFDMAHGEVTGLLGQNGAGKTTAIHMLCGLVAPTSGRAIVRGLDVATDLDAIRDFSGICPQVADPPFAGRPTCRALVAGPDR